MEELMREAMRRVAINKFDEFVDILNFLRDFDWKFMRCNVATMRRKLRKQMRKLRKVNYRIGRLLVDSRCCDYSDYYIFNELVYTLIHSIERFSIISIDTDFKLSSSQNAELINRVRERLHDMSNLYFAS